MTRDSATTTSKLSPGERNFTHIYLRARNDLGRHGVGSWKRSARRSTKTNVLSHKVYPNLHSKENPTQGLTKQNPYFTPSTGVVHPTLPVMSRGSSGYGPRQDSHSLSCTRLDQRADRNLDCRSRGRPFTLRTRSHTQGL